MKKGFTLIEMVIVVAVITILSGVVFLGSLNSFKTSKVEGFSNEALSLIRQLYDNQSSKSMFIDQVTDKSIEATYNIIFEAHDGEITAKLRNKKETIDQIVLSNIASIKDIAIKFDDEVLSDSSEYTLTFDSKGRIIRSIDTGFGGGSEETLKSLKLEVGIPGKSFSKTITITSPPAGNIVMEKGEGR